LVLNFYGWIGDLALFIYYDWLMASGLTFSLLLNDRITNSVFRQRYCF